MHSSMVLVDTDSSKNAGSFIKFSLSMNKKSVRVLADRTREIVTKRETPIIVVAVMRI